MNDIKTACTGYGYNFGYTSDGYGDGYGCSSGYGSYDYRIDGDFLSHGFGHGTGLSYGDSDDLGAGFGGPLVHSNKAA